MSMRRQGYEWRALVPGTGSTQRYVTTGQVILPVAGGTIPSIQDRIYYDIMVGGLGNNVEIPGHIRATQFVVIDHVACWPPGSAVQIRIDTTHYFAGPDENDAAGMPALASPFPEPNGDGILTRPSLMGGLDPSIYVLPGQTWGVEWVLIDDYYNGPGGYATTTDVSTTSEDKLIPRAWVEYLLLDGADAVIAMDLLRESIPVTADNIQWFKRMLIRQRLLADSAGRYDSAIENRPQTLG
jgi:hypothetical protein